MAGTVGSAALSPEQDESVGVNSRCELGERLAPTGLSTSWFQVCLGTTLEVVWGGRKQGSSQKTQPAPPPTPSSECQQSLNLPGTVEKSLSFYLGPVQTDT